MEIQHGRVLWYLGNRQYGIIVPDDSFKSTLIFFLNGYREVVISEKGEPVFKKDYGETQNFPFPKKDARLIFQEKQSNSGGKPKAFPWAYEDNYSSIINRLQYQLEKQPLYRIVKNNEVVWGDEDGQTLRALCKEFPNYGIAALAGIIQINEGCGWTNVLREPRPMEKKRYIGIPKEKK